MAIITHLPKPLTKGTGLSEALDALVGADAAGLPVLDETRTCLLGWITHQSVLAALRNGTKETLPSAHA